MQHPLVYRLSVVRARLAGGLRYRGRQLLRAILYLLTVTAATPGATADISALRAMPLNLPDGCTLLIGDTSPIGDGDPFMPAYIPPDENGQVHVRIVHFHLRPTALAFPPRSAWRYFDRKRNTHRRPHLIEAPPELVGPGQDIEVFIRRDTERLLAHLYVANPMDKEIELDWTQILARPGQDAANLSGGEWRPLDIHGGCGAYLQTIHQGDLPWVRQLRFKHVKASQKRVGSLHLTPSDMMHDRLRLVWEDRH
mgnify:CR=1 FL=1